MGRMEFSRAILTLARRSTTGLPILVLAVALAAAAFAVVPGGQRWQAAVVALVLAAVLGLAGAYAAESLAVRRSRRVADRRAAHLIAAPTVVFRRVEVAGDKAAFAPADTEAPVEVAPSTTASPGTSPTASPGRSTAARRAEALRAIQRSKRPAVEEPAETSGPQADVEDVWTADDPTMYLRPARPATPAKPAEKGEPADPGDGDADLAAEIDAEDAAGVTDLDPGESTEDAADVRRIGVGSVGPGTAWLDLPRLGKETVLVVRAGHASTAWLHTVSRQLADAGVDVIGVVLVHPDPRDRTDGTLWDGLHRALRGRVRAGNRSTVADTGSTTVEPDTGAAGAAANGRTGRGKRAEVS